MCDYTGRKGNDIIVVRSHAIRTAAGYRRVDYYDSRTRFLNSKKIRRLIDIYLYICYFYFG